MCTDNDKQPTSLSVSVELMYENATPPQRATAGSAGYDVRAYLEKRIIRISDGVKVSDQPAIGDDGEWTLSLEPGQMALIPLGFRLAMPVGLEAQVRPRSGQVFKSGLTVPNSPGTIDSDYAEEWMVMVRNDSAAERRVVHGERIAQVVFSHYASPQFSVGKVERITERAGGFGSTGHT